MISFPLSLRGVIGVIAFVMVFQFSAQPRKKEGEEKGGSLFHTHLPRRGLLEEIAPRRTQELSSERPESYHVGQKRFRPGQL